MLMLGYDIQIGLPEISVSYAVPIRDWDALPHPTTCFQHQATEDAIEMLRAEIYQTWLPKSGKRIAMPWEIEV
jgi:hypothetical protein